MRGLLVAGRYLTTLPLPPGAVAGDLGRAAGWFPVVGLVVGLLLAAAAVGAAYLLPPLVGAVVVVGLWVGLTGGLHLDGLGDTIDGLGGGWDREESLAIMRDRDIGAYGVVAIVLALALKIAVLASLPLDLRWRALLLAPALARLGPPLLARLCPPARATGAGADFVQSVSALGLGGAAVVAAGTALAILWPWGSLCFVAVTALTVGCAAYLRRRLGGLTGDCLGALVEAGEAVALVVVASLASLKLV